MPEIKTRNVSFASHGTGRALGKLGRRRPDWGTLIPRPASWDIASVMTRALLDRTFEQLHDTDHDATAPMSELFTGLSSMRDQANADIWKQVVSLCHAHPLCRVIHEEPFTSRTFSKPRGYAGDAVMIDYIYSQMPRLSEADDVSTMGETLFNFISNTPACAAVRSRRDRMAVAIDAACQRTSKPRILSVACGHLREAMLSESFRQGRVGELVALDSDPASLRVVEAEGSHLGVTVVNNSIKGLFRGPVASQKFDLVYSTGLYDYLDERMATKLTHRMFDMLNPGGKLILANFLPDIWCAGYMESFMSWNLIYRDAHAMTELVTGIDPSLIASCETFIEENENIIFMEVARN